MQFKNPHKRNLLCTAISLSLLPMAGASIAQDQQVEEVVVTGSFIRRSEGFTQASSVTQLDAVQLEQQGTLNIGEVVQNLTFVNGAASSVTNTIQGTDSRSSSVDLRGLGARSTLTLLACTVFANLEAASHSACLAIAFSFTVFERDADASVATTARTAASCSTAVRAMMASL